MAHLRAASPGSRGVFSLRWDTGSLASNPAAFSHRWRPKQELWAASSCIRTDELPATRRDARPLPARRQGHVRAQRQRPGQAARRDDFQGDTVHKSNFGALLVTSTPPTRRLPDGVAVPVPRSLLDGAPGALVDVAHRSPRARATTARTTTATSPSASAAGSTR